MNADVEKAVESLRDLLRFGTDQTKAEFEHVVKALRDQEALLRAVLNDNHATGHTTPETLDRITAHPGAKHEAR